ncbi:MAG: OmpA family protein [Thermodesulfovibrionales bacterium]|nr:OmpA family protein [Thermodesulfovibrionales bacterium]
MQVLVARRLLIGAILFSFLFVLGCAGMEFAPKNGIWYYPKELVDAKKAVTDAKSAGKDKICPKAYDEAKDLKRKAYETYWSCKDKEAISIAKDATSKAKALCPKGSEKVIDKFTLIINFDFDKATIRKADAAELRKATEFIKKYPGAKVRLEGHTDWKGTEQYNQDLSEKRSAATKEYLVTKGNIDASRISTVGYGETNPVASNKTDEGRFQNRRVEILILGD